MEQNASDNVIGVVDIEQPFVTVAENMINEAAPAGSNGGVATKPPKKKSGAMRIFRATMFMLRARRNSKSINDRMASASPGIWKKLVWSMRPLHLQGNEPRGLPPAQICSIKAIHVDHIQTESPTHEHFEEAISNLSFSPGVQKSMSTHSMSHYASADNLQELDQIEENDDDMNVIEYGENGGDEMIDLKAEEFIAQFYKQMRNQHVDLENQRYNEMIQRSIA